MSAHILVIDNEPPVVDVLTEILRAEGHVVVASLTPLNVDQVAEARPDLLILDLGLGHTSDGWRLLRHIKADSVIESLPVVLMSADLDRIHAHADAVARMPGVWMLIKPFTMEGLLTVVNAGLAEADGAEAGIGEAPLLPAFMSDFR